MVFHSTKKIKRLIYFRERERDIAAADMGAAVQHRHRADEERIAAEDEMEQELQDVRQKVGHNVRPEDLALAVQCAQSAAHNLFLKEQKLKEADQLVEHKRNQLLEAHRKVRQMESLHKKWTEENARDAHIKEQNEVDDLASTKEVRQ